MLDLRIDAAVLKRRVSLDADRIKLWLSDTVSPIVFSPYGIQWVVTHLISACTRYPYA